MAALKNVAFVGADSKLGSVILSALLKHDFTVTALKRASSSSPDSYPPSVKVVRIPDDYPEAEIASALEGQDAVVVSVKGTQVELQNRIANAAARAGVRRFIPADFGSCDSASPLTQELVPLYKRKTEVREHLQQLAEQSKGAFTWTSLVPGHFFDWQLEFLHLYLKERKADILDNGDVKFSVSRLERIGEATARVLVNAEKEETKNKILYVQSFCVNQNQIVDAFKKATGSKWEVTKHDSDKWRDEHKRKADDGDLEAIEDCVWYLGTVDANWEARDGFAMKLLGLEDEDLEKVVLKVVKDFE